MCTRYVRIILARIALQTLSISDSLEDTYRPLFRFSFFVFFFTLLRLTLLGPQSRFWDKTLIIRVLCPHIWECGAEGVKAVFCLKDLWYAVGSSNFIPGA